MARDFNEIDPHDHSPAAKLANQLRDLLANAGQPTLEQLAKTAHYGKTTLSSAFAGKDIPSEAVMVAIVGALEGDRDWWVSRRKEAVAEARKASRGADPEESTIAGEGLRDSTPEKLAATGVSAATASGASIGAHPHGDRTVNKSSENQAVGDQLDPAQVPEPSGDRDWRLATALLAAAVVAALVVALAIHSWSPSQADGHSATNRPGDHSTGKGKGTGSSSPTPAGTNLTLIFDGRGGGSSVIDVYGGPNNDHIGHAITGTYVAGQKKPAECRVQGRRIHSDPASGETRYTSNWWVRVATPPGVLRFATMVYARLVDQRSHPTALSALPMCPDSP